ncbi:MAG: hypothetical protein P8172_10370 [Gammaproteobacteria bacterium]
MPRMLPRVPRPPIVTLVAVVLLAACRGESEPPGIAAADGYTRAAVTGALKSPAIVEASGLAASGRTPGMLWVVNDGGQPPVLHAVSETGEELAAVRLDEAENRDWEDLAGYTRDGRSWLLIADIGDNAGVRPHVTLYVLPEPAATDGGMVSPTRTIRYAYPDGPQDAEAVAVDARAGVVYVLTKRTEPPRLYAVPLHPPADIDLVVADKIMDVASLPARDAAVGLLASAIPFHWQPTGMDFASDDSAVVVLTYADVYYYPRRPGESPADVLSRKPRALGMPLVPVAEGIAFDDAGQSIYVTAEGRHAPLLRFDPRPETARD